MYWDSSASGRWKSRSLLEGVTGPDFCAASTLLSMYVWVRVYVCARLCQPSGRIRYRNLYPYPTPIYIVGKTPTGSKMLDELLDAATEVQETDYGYIATFEDARMSVSNRPRTKYPRVWVEDVEVPQPITSFAFWNVKAWYHGWDEEDWQTPLMERDTVDSVEVELIQDEEGDELAEAVVMVE